MRIIAALLLVFLLASCSTGPTEPLTYELPMEVREVRRINFTSASVREIQVRVAVTDAPPGGLYLLPSDFRYSPLGDAPALTTSRGECTPGPVPEGAGQLCTLHFEWTQRWPNEEVVPGRVYARETVWSSIVSRGLAEAFTDE